MDGLGFRQTAENVTLDVFDEIIRRSGDESGLTRVLRVMSRRVRRRAAMEMMRSQTQEPWMRRLLECQEEIVRSGAIPYYLNRYRGQEISFWMNVPKWIYESSTRTRVVRCLDIGCAYGTLALFCKRLFDCEVFCLDKVTGEGILALTRKNGMSFAKSDVELDPFPWNLEFDLIIFTEVIEHLNFNPVPTLRRIRDHLAHDGRLYLSTPDAAHWGRVKGSCLSWKDIPYPDRGLPLKGGHIYQYGKDELCRVTDDAGLDVEMFDYAPGFGARHLNFCLRRK